MGTWTPPSLEKSKRLPQIVVTELGRMDHYIKWFLSNPGIPRTAPPIYTDFCLSYSSVFGNEIYKYVDIVHYDDDFCGFRACHTINEKKICLLSTRYETYEDNNVQVETSAPESTKYTEQWLKREGLTAVCCILAVQLYIAYHRPELIPVELPAPEHHGSHGGSRKQSTAKIKETRRVIIRLTSSDHEPQSINYRKIQWHVRGHYRHLQSGKLIYIKPHAAHRGMKKTRAKIEIQ